MSQSSTTLKLWGLTVLMACVSSVGMASPPEKNGSAATKPNADKTVSGKVTSSEDNAGLPGVSIVVKGTTTGTNTDAEGNFKINVANDQAVLVFSAVGFEKQEVAVGSRSTVNVSLGVDQKSLDEVRVVGYGSQKKSQMTGAISSVSGKQITELPITNARQALQGRAAGVDVTQAGSKPGQGPQVRIRGRRSFNASNDPLYVVDGIPLAGNIDDINPQDITSMEVLKDASSTAIYGSRGANGVVLITTRRGKAGKTVVSIDTYGGVNQELGRIEVMNGQQFAEMVRESRRTTGIYPAGPATEAADRAIFGADPVVLEGVLTGRSTDYVAGLLRQGVIQSHQIGVSGGDAKTQFNISGNFFKDVGVIKQQDFSRYTFRINLDHQITPKIKIGTSSLLVYSTRNGEIFNPIGGALQENPLGKPFDDQGSLIFLPTLDGLRTNPFAEIVPGAQVDETKRYRLFTSLFGEWKIMEGLNYRVNFGPDFSQRRIGRFTGSQTNARRGGNPTGFQFNEYQFNYTLENILTYNKKFGNNHNFNFTGLQSIQRDNLETGQIAVQGIPAESQSFYNLGAASLVTGVGTNLIQWTLLSYMGRLNYTFKDKYLLTATLRADGSSRFGTNTKYGYFPSVAVGWNISDETFVKSISWIDQLKLRLSYGETGNTGIDPYQTQALLGRTSYAWDNAPAYGYRPNTIGNPDLKWETSASGNVGLDFSFLNGKIAGSAEYYVTTTSDLLAPQPLPTSIGFGGFTTNIGKTQNRGFELTLSTVNVDKGGFQWTTDWVFNRNREEILELANGKVDDVAAGRFIGKTLTVFYDLKKEGIWQTSEADLARSFQAIPGQIKINDFNGDGRINVAGDRQIIGSTIPLWSGGMTHRFEYKGIDVNFFIFARMGQWIRSTFHTNNNTLAGRYNNLNIDYWTPSNPTNDFPRPNQAQEFPVYNSSLVYFDGSFVKLRNVNFGYNIPAHIVKKIGASSVRVFASIQQPFIWAEYRSRYKGIDPETQLDAENGIGAGEVNANLSPAIRTTTFGLNIKF
jgi:TonB-linked SusC/RagA family outer membrane protein